MIQHVLLASCVTGGLVGIKINKYINKKSEKEIAWKPEISFQSYISNRKVFPMKFKGLPLSCAVSDSWWPPTVPVASQSPASQPSEEPSCHGPLAPSPPSIYWRPGIGTLCHVLQNSAGNCLCLLQVLGHTSDKEPPVLWHCDEWGFSSWKAAAVRQQT